MKNTPFSSRSYFEITCILPKYWEEIWSCFCFEKGSVGVQTIEETTKTSTLKIFFNEKPLGGAKKLVEIFESEILKKAKIKILGEYTKMQENWQSNWFKHFYPVKIGETLIILPSWEKWEEFSVRHPVWIEPGQSFGTGHHISTVLALEILEKFLLGSNKIYERMLDIGVGSGILSIAACRLGVKEVMGVDIEQKSIEELEKNTRINGLDGRIKGEVGNPSLLKDSVSLIICNMILCELFSIRYDLKRLTNEGGVLICSGILAEQEHELRTEFFQLGFNFCNKLERENWCAIQFKKI